MEKRSLLLTSEAMLLTPEPGRPPQQAARVRVHAITFIANLRIVLPSSSLHSYCFNKPCQVMPVLQQTPTSSPAKAVHPKPGTGTSNTPGQSPAKALEAANTQPPNPAINKPSDYVDDSEWSSLCSLAAGIEAECSGNASGDASISGGWSDVSAVVKHDCCYHSLCMLSNANCLIHPHLPLQDGETLEATAEAYAQLPPPGGSGAGSPGQGDAAGQPFDSTQGSPAAAPRRPASRTSSAAARAVRAVSHLLARSTRLQVQAPPCTSPCRMSLCSRAGSCILVVMASHVPACICTVCRHVG
jgi:hypothetical protein